MTAKPEPQRGGPDIERLAAGLTDAQRRALANAEPDGHLGKYFIRWGATNVSTAKVLRRVGLAFTVWSGLCLTPLGLAVRQHLEGKRP